MSDKDVLGEPGFGLYSVRTVVRDPATARIMWHVFDEIFRAPVFLTEDDQGVIRGWTEEPGPPCFAWTQEQVRTMMRELRALQLARALLLRVLVARADTLTTASPCPLCGEALSYFSHPAACIMCRMCGWTCEAL